MQYILVSIVVAVLLILTVGNISGNLYAQAPY